MAEKTSKRKRISSKTLEELAGRKLTNEENAEAGRNLLRLARALKLIKKPKKEE
jgi:hypothetical protein